MSNTEVGVLIDPKQPRDAIHIAVAPVCASKDLNPGASIFFVDGSNSEVEEAPWPVSVGIVDPFLRAKVKKGQWFWMWLHPNTITSLRHDWTHPAFAASTEANIMSISEKWLRNFAKEVDADYDEMMHVAGTHCRDDGRWPDHLIDGGRWEGQGTPDEFWVHYEQVTGKTPKDGPTGIFSCSC